MDCSNQHSGTCGCMRRPQLQPPFGNMDFECPVSPICADRKRNEFLNMPIGMGYVPWQQWGQTYSMEEGLKQGTIFPELDYPFVGGGACYGMQLR